ncbi:MAG: translesion error-prone DNA polymerase V autoproteolytic subunit [Kiritimatiellae bacterium]|nr:translesion error-prone DNA polymerase V autoproteolytic subunit [Kiritimatiellia bacterium]
MFRPHPSRQPVVRIHPAARHAPLRPLRLYTSRIAAGFPSPADDHLESPLDLNEHLVAHPAATFMVRVQGDSMLGAGIRDGDLLVVDRSREAHDGAIVVAVIDGDLTVKRLRTSRGRIRLEAENPAYPPLILREGSDLVIWGVVAHAIRSY